MFNLLINFLKRMGDKKEMNLKNEKIFLCKKLKRSKNNKNYIFHISKIKRNENKFCEDNLSVISHYKNHLNENFFFKKEKFLLIDEILVPSFLNDFIQSNLQIQEKLKKYNEISYQFKDKEDVEIYMITKDSIISEELINEKII